MSFSSQKGEFDRFFNRLDRSVEESRPDRQPDRQPDRPVDPTGFHLWFSVLTGDGVDSIKYLLMRTTVTGLRLVLKYLVTSNN